MTVTLISPFGTATDPFQYGSAGWDTFGCDLGATGTLCPNTANFGGLTGAPFGAGNISVGVEILGGLTVLTASGLPGQGTCVDPIDSQDGSMAAALGLNRAITYYFELTWTELTNNTFQGGVGICDIAMAGQWDAVGIGVGSIILTPGGQIYANGSFQPPPGTLASWFPTKMMPGDTVGIQATIGFGQATASFLGAGGSIVQDGASSPFFIINGGPFVPCATFGNVSSLAVIALNANFGGNGKGSFLGPKLNPPTSFSNADIYGWPRAWK